MTKKRKPRDSYGNEKKSKWVPQKSRQRHTARFDLQWFPTADDTTFHAGIEHRMWRANRRKKHRKLREAERIHPRPPGTFKRKRSMDGTIYECRPDGWRKVGYKV